MSLSERRQIENEMIFRNANEKVSDSLDELDAQLVQDEHPELVKSDDIILHFICECSDENCHTRIPVKLRTYQKIHQNRDAFIVKPKHQVEEIEKIILTKNNYIVVEKNNSIAKAGKILNSTPVTNS